MTTQTPPPPAVLAKLGRNDPCWCGSGKKYKHCHQPADEEQRVEQMRIRRAQDTLLPKIIERAQMLPEAIPGAFEQFWQGRYSIDQMASL